MYVVQQRLDSEAIKNLQTLKMERSLTNALGQGSRTLAVTRLWLPNSPWSHPEILLVFSSSLTLCLGFYFLRWCLQF